jgi:hypothetical protein
MKREIVPIDEIWKSELLENGYDWQRTEHSAGRIDIEEQEMSPSGLSSSAEEMLRWEKDRLRVASQLLLQLRCMTTLDGLDS